MMVQVQMDLNICKSQRGQNRVLNLCKKRDPPDNKRVSKFVRSHRRQILVRTFDHHRIGDKNAVRPALTFENRRKAIAE